MTCFLAGLIVGAIIAIALCIRWAWRAMEPRA
jgi:hypothetical protein